MLDVISSPPSQRQLASPMLLAVLAVACGLLYGAYLPAASADPDTILWDATISAEKISGFDLTGWDSANGLGSIEYNKPATDNTFHIDGTEYAVDGFFHSAVSDPAITHFDTSIHIPESDRGSLHVVMGDSRCSLAAAGAGDLNGNYYHYWSADILDNPFADGEDIDVAVLYNQNYLTLAGGENVAIQQGGAYPDAGAATPDGATISSNAGSLDTSAPGTYAIQYDATKGCGVLDRVIQTVEVRKAVNPVPAGNLRDTSELLLDGAWDAAAFELGDGFYAAVTSSIYDGGLQIVNITNPHNPAAAGHLADTRGNDGLLLNNPRGVEIFEIDDRTYAAVAGASEHGIQIVDVTDPNNPAAAGRLTVYDENRPLLDTAWDIGIYTTNRGTFAAVMSGYSAIQIVDISDPANPAAAGYVKDTEGEDELLLNNARHISLFEIGTRTYAATVSYNDQGIQIVDVTNHNNPRAVGQLQNAAYFDADDADQERPGGIDAFAIGSKTYAAVSTHTHSALVLVDVSNPQNPAIVGELRDANDLLLGGAAGADTFAIGSKTYAAVASQSENGVQLVDVTDPASPQPAGSLADAQSLFLSQAESLNAFKIGSNAYAIVVSPAEPGVQLVQIFDIANPMFASAELDENTGAMSIEFDETIDVSVTNLARLHISDAGQNPVPLAGATFDRTADDSAAISLTLASSHLAQVTTMASPQLDIGTGAVTDDSGNAIDASEGNPISVAEYVQEQIILEDLEAVGQLRDDRALLLNGAQDVEIFETGGRIYAAIASELDGGFQIVDVTDPANPSAVGQLSDRASTLLGSAQGVEIFVLDGRTYAAVTSASESGLQIIDVTDPASPAPVGNLEDTEGENELLLENSHGVAVFELEDRIYAAVAAYYDNALQLIDITDPANPTRPAPPAYTLEEIQISLGLTDSELEALTPEQIQALIHPDPAAEGNLKDDSLQNLLLHGAESVDTYKIGDRTYAAVSTALDDGLQIIDVTDPVYLEAKGQMRNHEPLLLDNAADVEILEIGGSTYAVVTAWNDNIIHTIDVTDPNNPVPAGHLQDDRALLLQGAHNAEIFAVEGRTYAAVAAEVDDGIQIIDITDPASLDPTAQLKDTEGANELLLDGAQDAGIFVVGGATYAAVTSYYDDGLQIVRIASGDFAKPAFDSATLDKNTGEATITFDETIDISVTDLSRLYISEAGQAKNVFLTGAAFDSAASDSSTISVILTQDQLDQIIPMKTPQLGILHGAVSDLKRNLADASSGNPIAVTELPNNPPFAPSAQAETAQNTVVTITPVLSDLDADDTPRISAVGSPSHGTTIHDGTTITYTPNHNYIGADAFDYDVTDGDDTVQGTITMAVRDITKPVITLQGMSTVTIELGASYDDPGATVKDNDPAYSEAATPSRAADTSTVGTYTITYTAPPDASGNAPDAVSRTITIQDTTAPSISLTGDNPLEHELGTLYEDPGATADDGSTVTDDSSTAVNVNTRGDYTVTYTATDAEGNEGTATRTVHVRDTIAPVIELNGDATVTLELGDAYSDDGATVDDNDPDYAGTVTTSSTVNENEAGTYKVTYTAPADAANNSPDSVIRTVVIEDTTKPIIDLTGDSTATLELGDAYTEEGATVSDNDPDYAETVTITGTVDEGETGTYTITYTAPADAAGHSPDSVIRTVVIEDTTKPIIDLNGDSKVTLELGDAYSDDGATVDDNDPDYAGTVTTSSTVNENEAGTYKVTYTAPADAANNSPDSVIRTVVIEDTTKPIIDLNGDSKVTLELGDAYTEEGATVSDNDPDYAETVTITGTVNANNAGTYTITYTAPADAANNAPEEVTRTVTVQDTNAPVITLTGDNPLKHELGYDYNDPGATADDGSDVTDDSSTAVNFNTRGDYTVTYTATDAEGNEGTATRTVHVRDTLAPVIALNGDATVTLELGDAYTDDGATVSDNDPAYTTTEATVGGDEVDTSAVDTYTVTYTAPADAANNAPEEVTRTVTVQDTTKPAFASAILNENTGEVIIAFDETIDISDVDLTKLYISEAGGTNEHALTGAAFDNTADDSFTISVTLSQAQLDLIIPLDTPQLDIAQGAVSDLAGNGISASPDNLITVITVAPPIAPADAGKLSDTNRLLLGGANDVDTIVIGTSTYAVLAASFIDNGLQLVDVTDPDNPAPAGRLRDTNSLLLNDVRAVSAFKIGTKAYVAAASFTDNGLQLVDVTDPDNPAPAGQLADTDDLLLRDAHAVDVIEIGGSTYALVTPSAIGQGGLQLVDVSDPDNPAPAGQLADTGRLFLENARGVSAFKIGANSYAAVTSASDDGLQLVDITDPDNPAPAGQLADTRSLLLNNPIGIAVFTVGASTYAAVTSPMDGGLQLVDISNPARPAAAGQLKDTEGQDELLLNNPRGVDTFTIGEYTYAAVTSIYDDGLQLVDISNPARPAAAGQLKDTEGQGGLLLKDALSVDVFTIDGRTYAAVASYYDDGLQIVNLAIESGEPDSLASVSGKDALETSAHSIETQDAATPPSLPATLPAGADNVLWDATITPASNNEGQRGWLHSGLGGIRYHTSTDNAFILNGQTHTITGLYEYTSSSSYQLRINPPIPQSDRDSVYITMGDLRCSFATVDASGNKPSWEYADPTATFYSTEMPATILYNSDYLTLNGDDKMAIEQGAKYEDEGAAVPDDATITRRGDVDTSTAGIYRIQYEATKGCGVHDTLDTVVRTVEVVEADSTKPAFDHASLNLGTRELTITFDERIDVSATDLTGIYVSDAGQENTVSLDGADFDSGADNSDTISMTLSQEQLELITQMTTPQLDIEAGAVSDLLGNAIDDALDGNILVFNISYDRTLWNATITSGFHSGDRVTGWSTYYNIGSIEHNLPTTSNVFYFNGTAYTADALYYESGTLDIGFSLGGKFIPEAERDSLHIVLGDKRCSFADSYTGSGGTPHHFWLESIHGGNSNDPFSRGADTNVAVLYNANYMTLNGSDTVTVQQNASYRDAGAATPDGAIIASNATKLDTATPGAYKIHYNATKGCGVLDTAVRTVIVKAQETTMQPIVPSISPDTVLWNATITSGIDEYEGLRGWMQSDLGSIAYHAPTENNTFVLDGQAYSIVGAYDESSSSRYTLNIDPLLPQSDLDSVHVAMGDLRCSLAGDDAAADSYAWIYVDPTATFWDGADTKAAILYNQNYLTLSGNDIVTVPQGSAYADAGAATPDGATITSNASRLDISTPGTYKIQYVATKGCGILDTAVRTVVVGDANAKPLLASAALDLDTDELTIIFDKIMNISTADLTKMHVSDAEQTNAVSLAGAGLDGAAAYLDTISMTLNQNQLSQITQMSTPQLDIEQGAIQDVFGNIMDADPDNHILIFRAGADTVLWNATITSGHNTNDEIIGWVPWNGNLGSITYNAPDLDGTFYLNSAEYAVRALYHTGEIQPHHTSLALNSHIPQSERDSVHLAIGDARCSLKDAGTVGGIASFYNWRDSVLPNQLSPGGSTNAAVLYNSNYLTLTGNDVVTIEQGSAYVDAGASTPDGADIVSNATDIDTAIAGTYKIQYEAVKGCNVLDTAIRTVNVADILGPVFESAALDRDTREMTVTFNEKIDVSDTDLTKIYVSDAGQANEVALAGAAFDDAVDDSSEISVTLSKTQLDEILAMSTPQLDIAQGAVSDLEGNAIGASSDNLIVIMLDATPVNSTVAGQLSDTNRLLLGGANDVDTIVIGTSTYAVLAASFIDNGLQLVDVTDPDNPVPAGRLKDTNSLLLNDVRAVSAFKIGAKAYVAAASVTDNGLQLVDITDPDNPVPAGKLADADDLLLRNAHAVDVIEIGGSAYALVTPSSIEQGGLQLVDVSDPSNPVAAGQLADTAELLLENARGISAFKMGASTYAAVTSASADGLQLVDVSDPSNPVAAGQLSDTESLLLDDPIGIAVFTAGASTYAAVASASDDGLQLVDISNPSNPVAAGQLSDAYNPSVLLLENARGVDVFAIGAHTYAAVVSISEDSLQLVDISDPAYPAPAGHLGDDSSILLDGARNVDIFTMGAHTYAAVASYYDDGIQLVQLAIEGGVQDVPVSDTEPPVITLNGQSTVTIELGGSYAEQGATVSDNDPAYSGTVTESGTVDASSTGSYTITYTASADAAGNIPAAVVRTVIVEDTTAPVIRLIGQSTVTIELGGSYAEQGATVSDNDPDYSGIAAPSGFIDTSTVGPYEITYNAPADDAGNAPAAVVRTVIVEDTTAPVIMPTGDNPLQHELGSAYADPGATADDGSAVTTDASAVNVNVAGDYMVTYTATDSEGNTGTATRTVEVSDTTAPIIRLVGDPNVTVELGDSYTEKGATVSDNDPAYATTAATVGGDTVDPSTAATYTVTYSAPADAAGNIPDAVDRTVTVQDTTGPAFESASFVEATRVLTIIFDEIIDVSETDLTKLYLSNEDESNQHVLTDAAYDYEADNSATITMTIASGQLPTIQAINNLQLDIAEDAVLDLEGNGIAASPDNRVEYAGSTGPHSTDEQGGSLSNQDRIGADSKSASRSGGAQGAAPATGARGNDNSAPEASGSQNTDASSAPEASTEASDRDQAGTQAYAIANDKAPPAATVFKPSDGRLAQTPAGKDAGAFLMP